MTQLVGEALAGAALRLRKAGVPEPERDMWRLLTHALSSLGHSRNPSLRDEMDDAAADLFDIYITSREQRRPVSRITGKRWFFDHEFEVSPHVLDPRPESELLAEAAIGCGPDTVLDLGTGSGCLLLSVLAKLPEAAGLGIDCCEKALAVARRNALRTGCEGRTEFLRGDWLAGINAEFDVILANPPYIPERDFSGLEPEVALWEPRHALTPGGDGLGAYREIAENAAECLRSGGRLIVEIGPGQLEPVTAIFVSGGLESGDVHFDLDQRPRALSFCLGTP